MGQKIIVVTEGHDVTHCALQNISDVHNLSHERDSLTGYDVFALSGHVGGKGSVEAEQGQQQGTRTLSTATLTQRPVLETPSLSCRTLLFPA